ncbi:MAG: serine/threonine protein kinase, partial [Burkholderiales bacterium]|nr:serine/threonine protein kinase [Burkholderiales bacterium]
MKAGPGLPIGTTVGELVIRDGIGRGGFGLVYEAYDPGLDITVALKEYFLYEYSRREGLAVVPFDDAAAEIFEAGKSRFLREARLLAMLHERSRQAAHSLVLVHRVFQANETVYMVMKRYHGQTIRQFLHERPGAVSQDWLVALMLRILDALEALHTLPGERLIHRDVSPDNIILQPDGAPVLLDFGATRDWASEMTALIFKPGFSPIELYTDAYASGPWTDLYSLCAVAYHALSGVVPVEAIARLAGAAMAPAAQLGRGR